MTLRNPLRSISSRLTLGFFVISLAAVGVVFLYVTPQLESRLRAEKLDGLRATAAQFGPALLSTFGNIKGSAVDAQVSDLAQETNDRVTLLNIAGSPLGLQTSIVSDSSGAKTESDLSFDVAIRATQLRRVVVGTESGQGGPVAEAALPLSRFGGQRVAVFSTPLNDVTQTVAIVRRQVLIAGALAVVLALLAGLLVARALGRRIGRLERAARRVAQGDFKSRFPVDRDDELGQLALALDDMQRQLAQLDSARKRFIATASHELRTPIFSLGGFVELLSDEELSEEEREVFLGQVREQVARLRTLTTELLDLSRLEAGSLELRPEETDVAVLAQAVAAEFVPALTRHGSHLELRLPRDGLPAVCDPERVSQVLRILIDNALAHTPDGTDIVVAASRFDGHVNLAVRDFGPGIKRTMVERIFEPFYSGDDAQGAGLGLAIAHELAERMEGRLSVDSRPGRTTFAIELPA